MSSKSSSRFSINYYIWEEYDPRTPMTYGVLYSNKCSLVFGNKGQIVKEYLKGFINALRVLLFILKNFT